MDEYFDTLDSFNNIFRECYVKEDKNDILKFLNMSPIESWNESKSKIKSSSRNKTGWAFMIWLYMILYYKKNKIIPEKEVADKYKIIKECENFIANNLQYSNITRLEMLEKILSPKSLGMKLGKFDDLYDDNQECWLEGPCILIRKNIYEKMKNIQYLQ